MQDTWSKTGPDGDTRGEPIIEHDLGFNTGEITLKELKEIIKNVETEESTRTR